MRRVVRAIKSATLSDLLGETRPFLTKIAGCAQGFVRAVTGRGIFVVAGLVGSAGAGVATGIWLQHEDLPARFARKATSVYHRISYAALHARPISWRDIVTNLHVIQVATIEISDAKIFGGAIAEAAGNILIASPHGHLSYFDAHNQLRPLNLNVPMNIDALRSDPLYKEPMFDVGQVRTHALLAIRTDTETYDLYASFNRFARGCFEFVVARVSIEATDKIVRPVSEWRDVWVANPCITRKDRGLLFVGWQ